MLEVQVAENGAIYWKGRKIGWQSPDGNKYQELEATEDGSGGFKGTVLDLLRAIESKEII